ncbi:MAG TPA: C39 family peptidase [Kiritimatiellia bacterium]|nr:C39 family peptidase [Kiritimatiellia bacterium]
MSRIVALKTKLKLEILPQPDNTTCGPTCLHAVYRYFGDGVPLHDVVREVPSLKSGGTLGVMLANHALRRGYNATIYSYNIRLFDPTWFVLSSGEISKRLRRQARVKKRDKLQKATHAYIEFLDLGGKLKVQDLTPRLLRKYLNRGIPVLTGLSSTYLYQSPREYGPHDVDDDIRGQPAGHFVVLRGYDRKRKSIFVADPLESNPYSSDHQYELGIERVICSILLGIVTDDANLIIIQPKRDT